MTAGVRVELDGSHYRVVEKSSHTVIYKRYGPGPFRECMVWGDVRRRRIPKIGSVMGRVLAAAFKP